MPKRVHCIGDLGNFETNGPEMAGSKRPWVTLGTTAAYSKP